MNEEERGRPALSKPAAVQLITPEMKSITIAELTDFIQRADFISRSLNLFANFGGQTKSITTGMIRALVVLNHGSKYIGNQHFIRLLIAIRYPRITKNLKTRLKHLGREFDAVQ